MNHLVLVTGATGFLGQSLRPALIKRGYHVRSAVRSTTLSAPLRSSSDTVSVGNLGLNTDWAGALRGVSTIVHLAARTHIMHEQSINPYAEYRRDNVDATAALARASVRAGVRRFIYLSSVKVNGDHTSSSAYSESVAANPQDPYGVTKWEAEQVLNAIARDSGLHATILRPPMVYGPGVKGNFLRLFRWVKRGVPLPLASIDNRRSLIFVGNLVHAIVTCIEAPDTAGQTYLLRDDQDISTVDLIKAIARSMGVTPRLFHCPLPVLHMGASVLGKSTELRRLTESLQIDDSKIRRDLGWTPPHTLEQGLSDTAQWYYSRSNGNSIK